MNDHKRCNGCGVNRPLSDFGRDKKTSDGRRHRCKICRVAPKNKSSRRYGHSKKGLKTARRNRLNQEFNITVEQFDKMFEEQKGLCSICNRRERTKDKFGNIRRLSIDHCHKTGKIRGLLCSKCNAGLGFFSDDKNLVLRAFLYLKERDE